MRMVTGNIRRRYDLVALLVCTAVVVWGLVSSSPSAAEPSAEKPTIVLVHGAWADNSSWDGEVEALHHRRRFRWPLRSGRAAAISFASASTSRCSKM